MRVVSEGLIIGFILEVALPKAKLAHKFRLSLNTCYLWLDLLRATHTPAWPVKYIFEIVFHNQPQAVQ